MHKSALCCLFLTPTFTNPSSDTLHVSTIERLYNRYKNIDHDACIKERFRAFGELALQCNALAESDSWESAIFTIKAIKSFYQMARAMCNLDSITDPAIFAAAANLLPSEKQALLLRGIEALLQRMEREFDTTQAVLRST